MSDWEVYPLPETGNAGELSLRVRRSLLSPQLRNYRDLIVALPPGYDEDDRRWPVVYMQDGQNLFDPGTSYAGDWGLVRELPPLAEGGTAAIIVGIANQGRRRRYEYSPFRDIIHGGGGGDRYLAFIAETVKPLVDASFRTLPDRPHTVLAGSSLGGLISLYGLYRYADVFGAAGVQSPALWFADGAMLRFAEEMASLAIGRVYLDIGLLEDQEAVVDARALRRALELAGRVPGRDLSYVEDPAGDHEEGAWGRRFAAALPFLLGQAA